MRLELSQSRRIHLIGLQAFIMFLLPFWLLKLAHYFFIPLPYMFHSPSMIPSEITYRIDRWDEVNFYQTALNISTFLIFWVQHIIMASLAFKKFFTKIWWPFPFYQRLFYNIASSLLIYFVIDLQMPQNYVIFTLPQTLCLPIAIIGLGLCVDSNLQLENSLLTPYSFVSLMRENCLQKSQVQQVQQNGIFIKGSYKWLRHPMQSGSFMLLCFGNNVFTFEKCIMLTFLLACVTFGVIMQEKRLVKKYKQYGEYMKQVKVRFIPYLI